jgi:hypothetical protein
VVKESLKFSRKAPIGFIEREENENEKTNTCSITFDDELRTG